MISVKQHAESNGKLSFLLECQLSASGGGQKSAGSLRTKKFRCDSRGFADASARYRAARLACGTDASQPFATLLCSEPFDAKHRGGPVPSAGFGGGGSGKGRNRRSFVSVRLNSTAQLRYLVAICRPNSGEAKSVSFLCDTTSSVRDGQHHADIEGQRRDGRTVSTDVDVQRVVSFLRSTALASWRDDVSLSPLPPGYPAEGGRERALKHACALVEIDSGEKVDCVCGKNRSRGLMMACERCGAWEHADCQGFKNDKQVGFRVVDVKREPDQHLR